MALVAAAQFPHWGPQILSLTVGTTVLFELVGPPVTRLEVTRAGVTGSDPDRADPAA